MRTTSPLLLHLTISVAIPVALVLVVLARPIGPQNLGAT